MLWTKIKFGFKGFKSVRFSVLPALLSVLFCLLSCLPASAAGVYTFGSGVSFNNNYQSFNNSAVYNLPNGYSYKGATAVYLTSSTSLADGFENGKDVTASTSIIVSSPYSSNSSPNGRPADVSCPTFNSWIMTTDCQSSLTEQVYGNDHFLVYNFVITGRVESASNIINSKTIGLVYNMTSFSPNTVSVYFTPLSASAGGGELNMLLGIATSVDNVRSTLNSLNSNLVTQTSIIQDVKTNVTNIYNRLGNIENKVSDIYDRIGNVENNSNAERQQDAEDRENAQQSVDDSQTDASQASQDVSNASSSVTGSMSNIISSIINSPATDCLISITTGSNGALQLNNMNLCSAPPEVLNLIHTISGIVITVAVLWCAYSLFNAVMSILEWFQGERYKG